VTGPVLLIDGFTGGYRFLSNFYSAPVKYEGRVYPSSEHAYQAAKTTDLKLRAQIAKLTRPSDAKRFGRRVPLRPGWEKMKFDVMLSVLRIKFETPNLRKALLATGDAKLVEENDWGDRVWGTVDGVGQNRLGKLLMQVRTEIKDAGGRP